MGIVHCRWASLLLFALLLWPSFAAAEDPPPAAAPAAAAPAPPKPAPVEDKYVPPPKNLKLVAGHWTPYEPPTPPEGAQVHTVVAGDCLWNLAQHYYGDPYLWPTIWDANRWVTYSHWIYPGDPLVIPPKPSVVTEKGPEVPAAPPAPEVQPAPAAPPKAEAPKPAPAPTGPVLVPAAEAQEMACSAQLLEQFDPAPFTIAAFENRDKTLQAQGDIAFLSAGQDMGITPGASFSILRAAGRIPDPATNKPGAYYIRRLGVLRVIAVQATTSTAEITLSCDAVGEGDHLTPQRDLPIPMIERIPLAKLATPYPGPVVGTVVVGPELTSTVAGAGDIVGIDLSSKGGVTVGDRVLFWRPGPGAAPRLVMAQGVVLSTNGGGSMVKIIESRQEVKPGDKVEVL